MHGEAGGTHNSAGQGNFGGVITGAFLAESASVVDNKLNVSGGVLSGFRLGPDRQAKFVLVVLTQVETDSALRRVEVEIMPPTDDDSLVIEYELPEAAAGGEIGRVHRINHLSVNPPHREQVGRLRGTRIRQRRSRLKRGGEAAR